MGVARKWKPIGSVCSVNASRAILTGQYVRLLCLQRNCFFFLIFRVNRDDLLSAVSYALRKEVPIHNTVSGSAFSALLRFIHLLESVGPLQSTFVESVFLDNYCTQLIGRTSLLWTPQETALKVSLLVRCPRFEGGGEWGVHLFYAAGT